MKFDFDPEKSQANKQKHGVSLEQATRIWEGLHLELAARTVEESRSMVIGRIEDKLYVCIHTMRGEAVRLISCRRARGKEVELYHAYFKEERAEG